MTTYHCYECKNGRGECNYPCTYEDPIGELENKCEINHAVWKKVVYLDVNEEYAEDEL